jgi:hypothetical protein
MGDFLNNTSHPPWGSSGHTYEPLYQFSALRCENNPLHWTIHYNPIQWEIHFLTFFSFHQNAPKLFSRLEIWTFSFQNFFWNQFLTLESENTEIRVFFVCFNDLRLTSNDFWLTSTDFWLTSKVFQLTYDDFWLISDGFCLTSNVFWLTSHDLWLT